MRIEVALGHNPFLAGVIDGADDPQWWLEGSSYPIEILDTEGVEVLITSRELQERYGEAPVASPLPPRRRRGVPHDQPLLPAAHRAAQRPARGTRRHARRPRRASCSTPRRRR